MGLTNAELETILHRIHESRNFDFRNYKRATLRRRIERRMADRGRKTGREYMALLEREPDEFQSLISSMLIKVTAFFRDPEMWERLRESVLPELLASHRTDEELRVWCAGCATGEEAYSAAIAIAEVLGSRFTGRELKVFGTDVDPVAIAHARRGIYSDRAVEDVPKKLLGRWFSRSPEGWGLRPDIRRTVVFGVNNLVSDAPISRLNLILCRNVFIYLDAQLQKRALARFHYALRHHGILVLGKSELIPYAAKLFEAVDLSRRIYRRDGRNQVAGSTEERLISILEQDDVARAAGQTASQLALLEQFHRQVLHCSEVPVIATRLDGTITFWSRGATRVFRRTEGDMLGKKLSAVSLPGLIGDVLIEKSALVREGRTEREVAEGIVPGGEGSATHVLVAVSALRDGAGEREGLVYVVQDVTVVKQLEAELLRVNEERHTATEELQATNEELQSANEELETTNEELQSANEELQTTNEELQSTNEELETTNEELQSTNAELDTINRELAARTDELNRLGFSHRTIIRSLSSAVVVIEAEGRIVLWNLAAERLLGLPESEAIGQTLWTLRVPALSRSVVARIRRALAKNLALRLDGVGYELPAGGRGHATLAAIPLVDGETCLGAVVLFEDVTRAAHLIAENVRLRQERRR